VTAPLGVLLLGVADEGVVADVDAVTPEHVTVAHDPGVLDGVAAVLGVPGSPWPGWDAQHASARAAVAAPYYAIESWHRHPRLVGALTAAIERGLAELPGAHVLLTAPDAAGRAVAPEERLFLREAVETVADDEALRGATIAWDHALDEHATAPTVATVLTSLAEAHGRHRVVVCGLAPGTPPDPHADATAAELGMSLVQVAPTVDDLVACVAAIVETVLEHEELA
jgi:hypothetical protein